MHWIREPGDLPSGDGPLAVRDATAASIVWSTRHHVGAKLYPVMLARGHSAANEGISVSDSGRPYLFICTTCRAGRVLAEDETTPGARLHRELERLLCPLTGTAPVELRQVACLANCERGCSGAIAMPGKWTYLLGFLSTEHASDLLTYGAAYASSANGTVLPSRRPASLRYAVIGRVPPMEFGA